MLVQAGRLAARAYTTQRTWIQRRVESITFPHVEQRIARRQTSFDVVCPAGLPAYDKLHGYQTSLLPLSLVRRWPPHFGVDVSWRKDEPLTLPASRDGDMLDMGLLIGTAEIALGHEVPVTVADVIQVLTTSHPPEGATSDEERAAHEATREEAFAALVGPGAEIIPDAVGRALRDSDEFRGLARELLGNRVLWVPISCEDGERCLIKLTYEVPFVATQDFRHPSSWAWVGVKGRFDMPGIGRSRSSHLDIVFPAPLIVRHARIELAPLDVDRARADPTRQVFRAPDNTQRELRKGLVISELPQERHGSFYVESPRDLQADAYVNAAIEKHGYVRGALIASLFVFATLAAYHLGFPEVRGEHRAIAITVLLFVPGLLGFLVVRPGEHLLASGFLSGVRKLVILNAGWPLVAAIALILDNQVEPATAHSILGRVWAGLLTASAITTAMLLASSYLPEHERWLDDVPKRAALATVGVAGAALGLWNGITGAFWSGLLLIGIAIPPVILSIAWLFQRRRADDGNVPSVGAAADGFGLPPWSKRVLWSLAILCAAAAVVGVVVDIVQKATEAPQGSRAAVTTVAQPRLAREQPRSDLRTGLVGSCPAPGGPCTMTTVASRSDGRQLGRASATVDAGRSADAAVAVPVPSRRSRLTVTVTVEVTRADIDSVTSSRRLTVTVP